MARDRNATWMDSDAEDNHDATQLALPHEYQALARLLHGPREMPELPTPAETLAKHRPGKGSPDLNRLQEELDDQKAPLTLQEKSWRKETSRPLEGRSTN